VPIAPQRISKANEGNALLRLGEREPGTARLDEAISRYSEALEVYSREATPLYWARTQLNLGVALRVLGERKGDPALVQQAVKCHVGAWEAFSEGAPHYTSFALAHAREDIVLLKIRFAPAAYQQCVAEHSESLKRMGLL
jgi:tetratricopeptide (TPR) repeat protein